MYQSRNEREMQSEIDKLAKEEGVNFMDFQRQSDARDQAQMLNALRSLVPGLDPLPVPEYEPATVGPETIAPVAAEALAEEEVNAVEQGGKLDAKNVQHMIKMLEYMNSKEK